MKYILCGCIVVGFGYIGLCVRSHLTKREMFYRDLNNFIEQFIVNVNFLQINFNDYLENECQKKNYQYPRKDKSFYILIHQYQPY